MSEIFAYLRASTDKQDLDQQRLQILDYAQAQQLHIDEFVAITISSRKSSKERRINELQERLSSGDTLIVLILTDSVVGIKYYNFFAEIGRECHNPIHQYPRQLCSEIVLGRRSDRSKAG